MPPGGDRVPVPGDGAGGLGPGDAGGLGVDPRRPLLRPAAAPGAGGLQQLHGALHHHSLVHLRGAAEVRHRSGGDGRHFRGPLRPVPLAAVRAGGHGPGGRAVLPGGPPEPALVAAPWMAGLARPDHHAGGLGLGGHGDRPLLAAERAGEYGLRPLLSQVPPLLRGLPQGPALLAGDGGARHRRHGGLPLRGAVPPHRPGPAPAGAGAPLGGRTPGRCWPSSPAMFRRFGRPGAAAWRKGAGGSRRF